MAQDRDGFVDYTQGSTDGGTTGDLSNYYTKSQTTSLVTASVASGNRRDELQAGYKAAYATSYVEPTIVGGKITEIGIWTNSGKGTKLYTKSLEYSGDLLIGVVMTDEISGQSESKALTYLDGVWKSTNISYGA